MFAANLCYVFKHTQQYFSYNSRHLPRSHFTEQLSDRIFSGTHIIILFSLKCVYICFWIGVHLCGLTARESECENIPD